MQPGLEGQAMLTVTDDDTATALRSGDVAVLGTPRVLALCEEATVAAVATAVTDDQTTVGTRVALDHLLASRVGDKVTAHARLTEVDGRRLTFEVEARDGDRVVARGTVTRALVDRDKFLG